jgi:hypothetical protein
LKKLRSGIVGETEPLRQLGILVDDNATKHYAWTHGIAEQGKELDGQQKVLARYGLILDQTKTAQGDLARTIDSPTNQLRVMGEQVEQLATKLGLALLPAATGLIHALTDLVPYVERAVNWFSGLPEPVRNAAFVIAGLVAAIGPVLFALGSISAGIGLLIPLFTTALPAAIGFLMPFLGPIGLIAAGVAAVIAVWANWDRITGYVSKVYDAAKKWLVDEWEGSIFQSVARMFEAMGRLFGALLEIAAEKVAGVFNVVKEFLLDKLAPVFSAIQAALETLGGWWTKAKDAVVGTVTALYTAVKTWLLDKFTAIVDGIKGKIDAVTGFFGDMYDKVVGHSYVPDMVTEIGNQFGPRLEDMMVRPAYLHTGRVNTFFEFMGASVLGHIDHMFGGMQSKITSVLPSIFGGGDGHGGLFGQIMQGGLGALFSATGPLSGLISAGIAALGNLALQGLSSMWHGIQGLFGNDEEAREVNPKRDRFVSQFGSSQQLAELLTQVTGEENGSHFFAAMQRADTMAEFRRAAQDIVDVLQGAGHAASINFHTGGVVPGFGESRATLLGGEGVLSRAGMEALGALNRGQSSSGDSAAHLAELRSLNKRMDQLRRQLRDVPRATGLALQTAIVLAGNGGR